jgi:membrane protein implicated in regulation of membrane protease activity
MSRRIVVCVGSWVVWAVLAVALGVGEVLTPGLFFLGPVALAAVLAGLVAVAGGGVALTLLAFIIASVASVARRVTTAVRPVSASVPVRAIAGMRTWRRVDGVGGRVRIGGEEWTARSYLPGEVLEPGAHVQVVVIEGATALVTQQ